MLLQGNREQVCLEPKPTGHEISTYLLRSRLRFNVYSLFNFYLDSCTGKSLYVKEQRKALENYNYFRRNKRAST